MFNIRQIFCFAVLVAALGDSTWAANVTLAWNPSTDPSVAGYDLYYWKAGVSSSNLLFSANMIPTGTATSVTVTNLAAGIGYVFVATAYNSTGIQSPFSGEITYLIPTNMSSGSTVVIPTNNPPTLNAIANLAVNENAGPQTVNLTGITSGSSSEVQTLTVTATSSNPALIPNPTVNYTSPNTAGTLSFAPATNSYGTATLTVTVNDGAASNNLVSQSFTVKVIAVTSPPSLNPLSNLGIIENSSTQTVALVLSSGLTNLFQRVTVTAVSSNPALIPNPTVNYTSPTTNGSLSFAPVLNLTGTSTITVTVNNNQASNNIATGSFVVTVMPLGSTPPGIASPPTNAVAVVGQPVSFNVLATGSAPLAYQWQYNAANLPGATNAMLTLTNITAGQSGQYTVSVSNPLGSTNRAAALTIYSTAAATLTTTQAPLAGQFSVNVAGVPGFKYAVQASTNLIAWVSLRTNPAPFAFVDTNAGKFTRRFYRTVYLPN